MCSCVLCLVDSTTLRMRTNSFDLDRRINSLKIPGDQKKKTDGSFFLKIWKLYIIKTSFMMWIRTRTFDDEIDDNNSLTKWSDHPMNDKITLSYMTNVLSISLTSNWYFQSTPFSYQNVRAPVIFSKRHHLEQTVIVLWDFPVRYSLNVSKQ